MASLLELAQLSSAAYNPGGAAHGDTPIPPGWSVFDVSLNESLGGYFGVAYQNNVSREIVVAHRGTGTADIDDWKNNVLAFLGKVNTQFQAGLAFTDQVLGLAEARGFSGVAIVQTGHSLGGGLANLVAVARGQRAVGFDSIGVKESLAGLGYDANADYNSSITNLRAWFDPAQVVGTKIGTDQSIGVSSIPFVPDAIEPILAFIGAFVLRGLGPLIIPAYLNSQHSIAKMIETLKGLSPNGIRALVPDLAITQDGQLIGGLADALTSLQSAVATDVELQRLLEAIVFSDETALDQVDIANEQRALATTTRSYLGRADADIVVGVSGGDRLRGGAGDDVVAGGGGSDFIEGGTGNDFLVGGEGRDLYLFASGHGQDRIVDSDSAGALIRDGKRFALGLKTVDGRWEFRGTTYVRNGSNLEITASNNPADKITIKNFGFEQANNGYLGIRLMDPSPSPQGASRAFLGDKENWDSDPVEDGVQPQFDQFGNMIRADGQLSRPDIPEVNRADLFYGGAANEVERFATGGGNDLVYGDGPSSGTSTQGGQDLIETGAGRDIVTAGAGNDWIEGGSEADILSADEGDDVVYADTSNSQALTIDQAISAGEIAVTVTGQGDLLSGDAGDDVLYGADTSDLVFGGTGQDVIIGGGGDDTIYGDGALSAAFLDWSTSREITPDALYLPHFHNVGRTEDPAVGGLDVIYGGAGDDWVFAGAGDDYADGGVGTDALFGEAGNDALVGGAGDDVLVGDAIATPGLSGDDYLDGGAGADRLFGTGGADVLIGGDGDDRLEGGEGADFLYGGTGQDVLLGGAGKDTYFFNRGDGLEVIQDTPSGANDPEASVLVLGEGISKSDIRFRFGSLLIDLGQGDEIHFNGFDQSDPDSTPVLESIEFADGTSLSYQGILDQGFDLDGTEADDFLFGSAVTDRIDGKAGNDIIVGADGDDVITGGAGDDELFGSSGKDTYIFNRGDGIDLVGDAPDEEDFANASVLRFGTGIER
jgi:Ca2+-binding RTX toxin-like protein